MPDEPTNTTPDVVKEPQPTPATPDVDAQDVETPEPTDKHARTEQRLRRERNSAREQLQALQAELNALKSEQEIRMAEETATQLQELQTALAAAQTELKQERLKASLTGKVVDVNAALKLLSADHFTEDGAPDVEKFLSAYPFLTPSSPPTATAPGGGGGPQPTTSGKTEQLEQALTTARATGNRALVLSLERQLLEARKGR